MSTNLSKNCQKFLKNLSKIVKNLCRKCQKSCQQLSISVKHVTLWTHVTLQHISYYLAWEDFISKKSVGGGRGWSKKWFHRKQVGAPTVPSDVFKGSNEFEDFQFHWSVLVSQCVTTFSFSNWQIFYVMNFLTFLCPSFTLCHSVTHFMGVTLVFCVTHITYIIATCHWPSKVS
jgi:hypothetical protein